MVVGGGHLDCPMRLGLRSRNLAATTMPSRVSSGIGISPVTCSRSSAADPLSVAELRELGVFWQGAMADRGSKRLARDVFVTRLHVRYTAANFPEDMQFRETNDRTNFQGRYVLRHPWKGDRSQCEAAEQYLASLPQRFETEAQNLARLTGWELNTIRQKMASNGQSFEGKPARKLQWYQKLWKRP